MKITFTLLTLLLFTCSIQAQPKPAPKPAAVPQAAKPKGPSPYVMKRDYDSSMIKLGNRISAVQGSLNSIKGSINAKDGDINTLQQQMKQVEDVLNSTNFKISLTSDSLSQTRFSMEEIQKGNEQKFVDQENAIKGTNSTMNYLWVLAFIALVLPILVWLTLNKQIKNLESVLQKNQNELQAIIEENQALQSKQIQQLDQQIRLESRSSQHYAERLNAALKEEIGAVRNETEKFSSTLNVVTSEINDLHEKINNKS